MCRAPYLIKFNRTPGGRHSGVCLLLCATLADGTAECACYLGLARRIKRHREALDDFSEIILRQFEGG